MVTSIVNGNSGVVIGGNYVATKLYKLVMISRTCNWIVNSFAEYWDN